MNEMGTNFYGCSQRGSTMEAMWPANIHTQVQMFKILPKVAKVLAACTIYAVTLSCRMGP